MLFDCHTHPLGHEGGAYSLVRLRPFVEQAVRAGLTGIGFTDHEWYSREIDPEVISFLQLEYPNMQICLGLEIDYSPERKTAIKEIVGARPYDYIIGSVHAIDDWLFDHPDYREEYNKREINDVYEAYFALLQQAVETGLFQIVGHLDLIKVFGYRYRGRLLPQLENLLQAIKSQGMAVELNTNGLNKPVKEMYPQHAILTRCHQLQIPIALSSDAHLPRQVGQYFGQAVDLLRSTGYLYTVHFQQKRLIKQSLPLVAGAGAGIPGGKSSNYGNQT